MNQRHVNQLVMQAVRTICARRSGLSVPVAALLGFSMVSVAFAGPTGGVVVTGDATISTPAAGMTVIEQSSQHVQLNWNTFDVAANESVQFQQPSSSAVALNRILDQNPSQIFGRLEANGQVILVNPNGILFGQSAQLNVGSLVASSLDVIGFDAATGRYTFGTSRSDLGAIVNNGAITAARGGSVTLLGGRVTNTGSILADFGSVNLAAGRAATLDLAGDGLLRLEVDGELLSNNAGASAAVENSGTIEANGGQVLLTARAVDDVFTNLVNNTGVVRANRIDDSGGTIRLMGAGGTVRSSGVLDASAGDAVSSGGTVEMLGEQVGLFGAALVDVSGATGGGTALIGGDYQGQNPNVLNAARTYVGADASIRADAGLVGDGGRVIVWADEITRFNGSISARGGSVSGDGGFAEVSGKGTLVFRGSANLSASNGFAGELLLDPRNIIVATGGVGDLDGDTGDDGVANYYAFAEDAADDITIAPTTITDILDGGTLVMLQAHNDITITDAIDGSASATPGGELIFRAGDDIFINADVRTNNGAIQFAAGDSFATPTGADGDDAPTGEMTLAPGVTISAGAAAVVLLSNSNLQLLGTVSGNAITAASGGALTVATLNAGTGAVNLTGTGSLLDDGNNATRITGGALTLNAGTAIGATGATGQIDTNVASLTASVGFGGVYIGEVNGLTLTNVNAGGGNDVVVTSAAGDIVVNTVSALDEVWLNATAGSIIDDNNNATRINAGTLTLLAGTAVGAAGATGQIDTNATSLTAVAGSGGVYIGELNGLTLTTVSASGFGSDIEVASATGDIVVNAVSAPDAVTLTATAGAITDDNNNGSRIAAGALTLTAGTAIGAMGANGQIDTNVNSLTATANAGGLYIGELNGLTLTNVRAIGGGNDVEVTSTTGNVVVNTVSAWDAVTLAATNGAITDDDNDASVIAGASVSLSAATNIGTVVDFAAANDADVGSSLDVQTNGALTASVASNIGQINLNISGAPSLATGAITLGSGSNRAGAIVLQSAGNLNVTGLAPGAINIGSNNTTSVGLRSGSTLILPPGGGFTDQPADRLLVQGAQDVVEADGTPHEFTFAATALDFRSGALSGATTLNTTVDLLNASVGNNQNLTVNETNGLTLGSLDAGNGNIVLTAGGAVIDDGDDLTRIVSNTATLSGSALGTAGNALDTRVSTLTASATSGGVYINEADALALTVSATGGATDVRTANGSLTVASASGNGVTLIAGGAGNGITLNGAVNAVAGDVTLTASGAASGITLNGAVNAGTGNVTLTAGTVGNRGAIVAGAGSQITGGSLTATGSTIGSGAARLNTTVASLNATSTNGGIFITETDALNLTASATNGVADVRTTNGALGVTSVTGDVVTLTTGGAGNGITLNGAVNAVAGDVTLTAGGDGSSITINGGVSAGTGDVTLTAGTVASRGAIVAGAGNQVTGGSFTATGSTIGTDAARLNTTVASLNATSTNGGIFVTESNALNLTASATNGIADVRTTNGALGVTSVTGDGVTLTSGGVGNGITLNGAVNAVAGDVTLTTGGDGSSITLNGAVNAGTGDVTMTAGTLASGGAIVAGAGSQITGGSLTATGSMIGTDAARLNTTVASLNARSTNGGIFITETDALNLTASATNGAADVRTTNGALAVTSVTGDGVTLTTGGDSNGITLNGAVNAMAGDVTLSTGGVGSGITLNGAVNAMAGDVTLTAGGDGSNITLNGALSAGAGDVTLTAGTVASRGAIVAGSGNQVTGGSFTATGSAVGTDAARLNTTVASLNATSTNGGIFITESDALNLTATATNGIADVRTTNGALGVTSVTGNGVTLTAGGAGNGITLNGAVNAVSNDVTLTANGDGSSITLNGAVQAVSGDVMITAGGDGGSITLNSAVNAGAGDVTLTAGTVASRGAIVAGAGNQITGGSLTASGSIIGTGAARLNTSVNALNATSTNGGIFIDEADALNLTASATGGAVDVRTGNGSLTVAAVSGAGVTLTAGGAGSGITLNGALNAATGDVALSAGTPASRGAIVGTADHSISGRSLTATAASIGASNARLNTSIDTLNAVASTGDVYVSEQSGLTLANVSAAHDVNVTSIAGDIVVNTVTAANGVTLAASSGAIADDGNDSTRLSANSLTLNARSIGAASTLSGTTLNSTARLDTEVTTLNATATAGGIFIDEANGLQSASVQASGGAAGDIELLTLAGDLILQQVNASDTLLLAAGRNLFAAPGAGPVTARVAELRAGTTDSTGGQIGALTDLLELQLSAGNSLRLFVPQTIDPNDPNRAPATLPSAGVTTTLNLFGSLSTLAAKAGFNQFQGLGETQFTSPAEALVKNLQSQTGTVQAGLDIDWVSFDSDVSLFGTLEPSVCLPGDQRDEEESTPGC